MDSLRLATLEEAEYFTNLKTCDLTSDSRIVTFGGKDFGVLRKCWELDPVFYDPNSNLRRRTEFVNNIETALRFQGAQEYYFNCPASDEPYLKVLKHWGGVQSSPTPELRFKKVL